MVTMIANTQTNILLQISVEINYMDGPVISTLSEIAFLAQKLILKQINCTGTDPSLDFYGWVSTNGTKGLRRICLGINEIHFFSVNF